MALGVWSDYKFGWSAPSGNTNYRGGFRYKIIDTGSDRILNNRSLIEMQMFLIKYIYESDQYTPWNLDNQTSSYYADGALQGNTTTRFDFTEATTNTYYYTGDHTSVIPYGENIQFYVYHNSDGSRDVTLKSYFAGESSSSKFQSCMAEYAVTLDTIPRGSVLGNIADFTYDSSAQVGVPFSVPCTKYASSYYDVLTIKIGNDTIATRNNYSSGNVTLTASEIANAYSKMTTSMYTVFTFELRTYTDSSKTTQIGNTSSKTGIKGYISEADAKPLLPAYLFSYMDSNLDIVTNITHDNSKIIQGKSNLAITMSGNGTVRKGATFPANCYIFNNIVELTASSTDTFPLTKTIDKYSNKEFSIKLTDSRGNNISTTITISDSNFIEYSAPSVSSSILAQRVNFASTQAAIKFEGIYTDWNLATPNDYTQYKYRVKEANASWPTPETYIQLPGSILWNDGSFSYNIDFSTNLADTFALDKAYDIEVIVTDQLSRGTRTFRLPSALPLVDLDVDNKRIGINKMAGITKGLDVSGKVISDSGFYNSSSGRIIGNMYGICNTAAATTAKTVAIGGFELVTGILATVKFVNSVPTNATLNIDSTGAKSIYNSGSAIKAGVIPAGAKTLICYNGTQYDLLSVDTSITESGSNSNGSYTKFDDGTMVCYYRAILSGLNYNADAGYNSFVTSPSYTNGIAYWTFPMAFVGSIPDVNCGIEAGGELIIHSLLFSSLISTGALTWNTRTSSNSTIIFNFQAIGRWK